MIKAEYLKHLGLLNFLLSLFFLERESTPTCGRGQGEKERLPAEHEGLDLGLHLQTQRYDLSRHQESDA